MSGSNWLSRHLKWYGENYILICLFKPFYFVVKKQQQQRFHITRSYRPVLPAPVACYHSNHDHPHGPVRKINNNASYMYIVCITVHATSTGHLILRATSQRNLPQKVKIVCALLSQIQLYHVWKKANWSSHLGLHSVHDNYVSCTQVKSNVQASRP